MSTLTTCENVASVSQALIMVRIPVLQYSALSYALNFIQHHHGDAACQHRGYSTALYTVTTISTMSPAPTLLSK